MSSRYTALYLPSASPGISASIGWSGAPDSTSITAPLSMQGAVGVTSQNDTNAILGSSTIGGDFHIESASDAPSMSGMLSIGSAINCLEISDIGAAAGSLSLLGVMAWVGNDDVTNISASTTQAISAGMRWSSNPDTWGIGSGLNLAAELKWQALDDVFQIIAQAGMPVFDTPEERIYHVPMQNRKFVIPAQNRKYTVPAQNRTYLIKK